MLVETQNEEAVAAVSPFVPLRVASLVVMFVGVPVVGAVAANASGATAPNVPSTSAEAASIDKDLVMRLKIVFFMRMVLVLVTWSVLGNTQG